jgi:hypothetical protein
LRSAAETPGSRGSVPESRFLILVLICLKKYRPMGDRGSGVLPMVRWLDYDPIAAVVLLFGLSAVVLLALSI